MRSALAPILLSIHLLLACSAPPPEERPCLKCQEIVRREQEKQLCKDAWPVYEHIHGCRCAPSAPCEGSCTVWCANAPMDSACAACTTTLCPDQVAECRAGALDAGP